MLCQCEVGDIEYVVVWQLMVVVEVVGSVVFDCVVLVYELVWVIGIGLIVLLEQVQVVYVVLCVVLVVCDFDVVVGVCFFYGGSVKVDNVVFLFVQLDIDGGLIGGVLLNEKEFIVICWVVG